MPEDPKVPDLRTLMRQPDPPKYKPEPSPKCRQKPLFSGLGLLAGQQDLFPTDGEEKP